MNGHTLFEEVVSLENLVFAWQRFSRGKIRKPDVRTFALRREDYFFTLHEQLVSGRYRHGGYEQFTVHDPKRRQISKARVEDRLVHQAIVQVIEPLFERRFIFDSYSSRLSKGTHAAVLRLETFLRRASGNYRRRVFVLQCDIRRFFDSIRHDILLRVLDRAVGDLRLMDLIAECVRSYAVDALHTTGLPLGNVTSQLFANAYLDSFDHFVKEQLRIRFYVRFCDDFLVVDERRERLVRLLPILRDYLQANRALELHPRKVRIRNFSQGVDFLGQVLRPYSTTLRTKTRRRLFRKTRRTVAQYHRREITGEEMRQSLQSALGLLKHASNHGSRVALRTEAQRMLTGSSPTLMPGFS